jgi:predicted nucleic acid-binding Zn ribbon protein
MRKAAPRSLAIALDALGSELAPATTLARVQEVWADATGTAIGAAARPTGERDGVLTVLCEAAVWAHELTMMEADLVVRINASLGTDAIRELRCRTGDA